MSDLIGDIICGVIEALFEVSPLAGIIFAIFLLLLCAIIFFVIK
jgi:hypothetical protein